MKIDFVDNLQSFKKHLVKLSKVISITVGGKKMIQNVNVSCFD